MELISIVVPVYKVEAYLDRCVESIVNQTYQNLEIILVDDGSPDNCPAMCEAWATKDNRIRVIHKTNGGLSDARNAGMKAATGDYIGFVDSDDWIEKNMYNALYNSIKKTDSDIASCGALRVWGDGTPSRAMLQFSGDHTLEGPEAMKALIESTYLIQVVWNKLYKTDLIRTILFEVGKIHEDEFWSWQAIGRASRVTVLEENLYYYQQRPGSIMDYECIDDTMLFLEAKLQRREFIREHHPSLTDIDSMDILFSCYYLGREVIRRADRKKQKRYMEQLENAVKQCKIGKAYLEEQTHKRRFQIYVIQNHLEFVCRLYVALGRT